MDGFTIDIPSERFRTIRSTLTFVQVYLMSFGLALLALLLSWPISNLAVAIEVAFSVFTAVILSRMFLCRSRHGHWHLIVAELMTPGFLWLLFGFGGILSLLRLTDIHYFGIKYDSITVIIFSLYAFVGAVCYIMAFRVIYRDSFYHAYPKESKIPSHRVLVLLLIILSVDWYSRYKLINSGLYFIWVMKSAAKAGLLDKATRGTDLIYHIQRTISPIALSLLAYLMLTSRRRLFYSIVMVLQVALIAVNGDRSDLVYSGLIIFLSYAVIRGVRFKVRTALLLTLFLMIFFGVLSPVIQEARIFMRRDARKLIMNPMSIPRVFVFEYIPKTLDPEVILGTDESVKRQSLMGRFGSYMTYAASMYESMLNGKKLQPLSAARDELSLLIPRVLYPQKPSVDADAQLQRHFRIGIPGHDTNGTHLVGAFSFFHIPGVMFLFIFAGMAYGLIARYLGVRYGLLGNLILIGLFPLFVPTGDTFVQVFGNIRNIVLFLPVVAVVLLGFKALPKPSHRVGR